MEAQSIKIFDFSEGNFTKDKIREFVQQAKNSRSAIANLDTKRKNQVLVRVKELILANTKEIINVNEKEVAEAREKKLTDSMVDRLILNEKRLEQIAESLQVVADLDDPVAKVIWQKQRPNGLLIKRRTIPLGVIGMIYESRPNVTIDSWSLCFKSGNILIMRPGSESFLSSQKLLSYVKQALTEFSLPTESVFMMPDKSRKYVDYMLSFADEIDVVIPRGGKQLIKKVSEKSKIPVLKHLDGNCHVYVHQDANMTMAKEIILNAKFRRVGICGALESIVVDKARIKDFVQEILPEILAHDCEVRGDEELRKYSDEVKIASQEDYYLEYLAKILSVKTVNNLDEAIEHINKYSSEHTEAIVTSNDTAAQKFLEQIDSAIVMHNSSTQFADGGEFGLGAEIGIATGRIHARGPVGLEQLVTFKYQIHGSGQIRD